MRLLIQRVKESKVIVEKKVVGSINNGVLVFFASQVNDDDSKIQYLVDKLVNLRIFSDDKDGKMNFSLKDINGEVLVVSQFTLYANCLKGRRPSFINAQKAAIAKNQYDEFVRLLKKDISISKVETGVFAAMMEVHLINDGPATFIIDN